MAGRTKSQSREGARKGGRSTKGGEPSARERILATANKLFYREGIRSIGIDTVIAASGVAKASLYRHFASKDALIEAYAAERNRAYWAWWDGIASQHPDDARALLDALLTGIAQQIRHPAFRGCPFLNLVTEFPSADYPGWIIAKSNKDDLKSRLSSICANIGTPDHDSASGQLLLLINGAYSTGWMATDIDLPSNLREAAARVIA
jgi:AcrR family transcriptional regulator